MLEYDPGKLMLNIGDLLWTYVFSHLVNLLVYHNQPPKHVLYHMVL